MNLATLAERNVETFGPYVSLVFEGREYTNVELLHDARVLAGGLKDLGLRPGDRVGIMLPNIPHVGVCYAALLRIGAIIVPMVFLLTPREIQIIERGARPRAIVTTPDFLPNVREAIRDASDPPMVIVIGDAGAGDVVRYADLTDRGKELGTIEERRPHDPAVIVYTSGTTGRPKGVVLSHGNMLFNAQNASGAVDLRHGDTGITCLPLAHLFGLGNMAVGHLFRMRGVLLRWFTVDAFFNAVREYRACTSALVPAMLAAMLAHPELDAVDWKSLRHIIVGGAPVPVPLAEEFERRTGARVLEGYGMTEASPSIALMRAREARRPGSCGRPLPGIDVVVRDDDGVVQPPGVPGEICVRGPNVMQGYYELPEETAEAIQNGWLHTGDIGYLDLEGYLFITDRKKDLVIRGGFNVSPREVEDVLGRHPAVAECAVVGMPDPRLGEIVKAYVVRKNDVSAHAEDLLVHCRAHLARYKVPASIGFVDALPKTLVGKILKKELRDRARAESSAAEHQADVGSAEAK